MKNNNPAGITYNDTFAKNLTSNGIKFEKGTTRPANEGGNYFSFPNISEGFKAYDLLWSSPSYQNLTVGDALKRWGTGNLPGVDTTKMVSSLTADEKRNLQMAQIKKESPGMYKVLTSQATQTLAGIPKQAADVLNGNINLASLDAKARSAVTKHISDNDLVNGQTGNMKFL